VEREQTRMLSGRRDARDQQAVDAALAVLIARRRTDDRTWSPRCWTRRAEATLGEICDAPPRRMGLPYTEPASF